MHVILILFLLDLKQYFLFSDSNDASKANSVSSSSSNFQKKNASGRYNNIDDFWNDGSTEYKGSMVPKVSDEDWYDGDGPKRFTKIENE